MVLSEAALCAGGFGVVTADASGRGAPGATAGGGLSAVEVSALDKLALVVALGTRFVVLCGFRNKLSSATTISPCNAASATKNIAADLLTPMRPAGAAARAGGAGG